MFQNITITRKARRSLPPFTTATIYFEHINRHRLKDSKRFFFFISVVGNFITWSIVYKDVIGLYHIDMLQNNY
jgi:hypothetical protein